MADGKMDERVLETIKQLVEEEHKLLDDKTLEPNTHARLETIRVELDQCWDLLRQRRALREFGDNPGKAHVRPPNVVENYEQ